MYLYTPFYSDFSNRNTNLKKAYNVNYYNPEKLLVKSLFFLFFPGIHLRPVPESEPYFYFFTRTGIETGTLKYCFL